jgi:hypothetical protein
VRSNGPIDIRSKDSKFIGTGKGDAFAIGSNAFDPNQLQK